MELQQYFDNPHEEELVDLDSLELLWEEMENLKYGVEDEI